MPAASPPGRKTLFWLYQTMLKIRRFEEELHLLFLQGELPVIFFRENNLYGAPPNVSRVMWVKHIADRAAAYGMADVVVDGMDVLAVYDAVQEAVARSRAGQGPSPGRNRYYWRVYISR